MKKYYFLVLSALCISQVFFSPIASANDQDVEGIGGRFRPIKGENNQLQMVKEKVVINVYRDTYQVVADFEFANTGIATVAKMGFPESAYPGKDPYKSSFINFQTSVDGTKVPAQRVLSSINGEKPQPMKPWQVNGFDALWLKDVAFGPKQTRHIQVAYKSRFGRVAVEGPNMFIMYQFTGQNWKGLVKESVLEIVLHEPGHYLWTTQPPGRPENTTNGSRISYRWTNWQAQGDFVFYLTRTLPNWMIYPRGLQIYSDYNAGDSQTLARIREVDVPGTVTAPIQWMPPVLKRDGILYANLGKLKSYLEQQRPYSLFSQVPIQSFNTRDTGSLRVGDIKISYWSDQPKLKIEGGDSLAMPSLPFCIIQNYDGWQKEFYVPLAPTIQALQATLWTNTEKRRVYFEIPALRP